MLGVLKDLSQWRQVTESEGWWQVDEDTLRRVLPFWTGHDIQRIAKSLSDKGVVRLDSAPFLQSRHLIFAFNDSEPVKRDDKVTATANSHNVFNRGANRIAPNWQPSDEVLAKLAQYNIPKHFAMEQLPEFITYWRERDEPAHAWGAKFIQRVKHAWRNHETEFRRQQSSKTMDENWRPGVDAIEILINKSAVSAEFIEDAIPEFILYWREKDAKAGRWDTKFIQHVRKQWAYFTAAIENDSEPKLIPSNWQPGDDVFDVLRLANIDIKFAQQLIPEFILFWRDSKKVYPSWNTKFLQHVKYCWAKQGFGHPMAVATPLNSNPQNRQSTRERSLEQDLTDRSWAY